MKRPSYSVSYVNSAIHRTQFCVPSKLHELLIVWAETTPGLHTFKLEGPTYEYLDGAVEKTTSVPMTVTLVDGCIQHWDFSRSAAHAKPSPARQVRAAHALHLGIEQFTLYEPLCWLEQTETRNRLTAHTLLYQGATHDTALAEASALTALHNSSMSLESLTTVLELTSVQTSLVFLRCWLKGRLHWDIKSEPLGSKLMVGRK